jgi:RNA polymerase sigma-70 factor (ECF subfamily)
MSDQDLVQECVKSNPAAQKVLYERYYSRMLALCLRYSDSKDDAKDSLHDGFILLFSKIESYSGKGSFEGWMRRVFVNNMLMKFRKRDVFKESVSVDDVTWNVPVKEDVFEKSIELTEIYFPNQIREIGVEDNLAFNVTELAYFMQTDMDEKAIVNRFWFLAKEFDKI